ncbi:hypothetical protein [Coleofasciculus sp.]|uniref:hypothetical protein n=1 Tax=Coleofasciculus sp. TaxID=3100458 RepID=UPI0039FAE48B
MTKKELPGKLLYIFVFCITVIFCGISVAAIIPSYHSFEGNLVVEELNFTYAGLQPNQLFLQKIRGIDKILVEGEQFITLNGTFESQNNPKLNQLKSITIELPSDKSKWSITPVQTSDINQLTLEELRLQNNTKVAHLSYYSFRNRLSLELQPGISPNDLNLYLGSQPLRVIVEGYRILELDTNDSVNSPNELEFIFKPTQKRLKVDLPGKSNLYIVLSEIDDSSQWFRGGLKVKDVLFYRLDKTGVNIKDNLYHSTIIEGVLTMAERELSVKKNQFLIIGKFGINSLQYLLINHQKPEGLEVGVAGKSKKIQVGLDYKSPAKSIQASFLNEFLPQDITIAILAFCAAVVSYLLFWLIDNYTKLFT